MNAVTELNTTTQSPLAELEQHDGFIGRHIGPDVAEQQRMLTELGYATRKALMEAVVPATIRLQTTMPLGNFSQPKSEQEALAQLRTLADKNQVYKSFIGQGDRKSTRLNSSH